MKKMILILLSVFAPYLYAQPDIVGILSLNDSLVQVSVDLGNGKTGTGSGVVVSKEYVATNCHVLANAKGADISKYRDSYTPIAIKADWKHDLCLLKFEGLPFKPVKLRDAASLKYEEEIFSLGYPVGNNVPQPSFGYIKATYALDGGLIIRTNAAFALGSSGGGLFDQQFNLIGITTFKSPGSQAYFYNLPADWIKTLMAGKELDSLATDEVPFWALPLNQRPYFMQVVIPFQNREWASLKEIARLWTSQEENSPDAWYYLAQAEIGLNENTQAKSHLKVAQNLNQNDLDVLLALSEIALVEKDMQTLENLNLKIASINTRESELLQQKIAALKAM